jgi:glycosyltransferase involved in cell wall biosynthesis
LTDPHKKLRVASLAYYPATLLKDHLVLQNETLQHPASWIVVLTNALAKRSDIELHIVAESMNVSRDQDVIADGVHYHFIKMPPTLNLSTLYFFNIRRLISKVRDVHPDLVHAHGTEGSMGLAGVYSNLPCLLTIQGVMTEYNRLYKYWLGRSSLGSKLTAAIERHVLRRASFVGTRTDFATEFVQRINPDAKIIYTPEAVNELFFNVKPRLAGKTIVYVGGLVPRKDPITLVKAFGTVNATLRESVLILIGSGPESYKADLLSVARECRVEDSVTFLGYKDAAAIAQTFETADVLVLPSLIENSPNVLAEAMCAGLPVVATRVGGIPSMVDHGVDGLLVDPRNPSAMAEAILKILGDADLRCRLAKAAREKAWKTHKPDIVAEQTVGVYRKILELDQVKH